MSSIKIYQSSWGTKLFFLIFLMVSSFLVSMVVGFITVPLFFKISIFELSNAFNNLDDPQNMRIVKYFQTLQSIGLFIVPALWYSRIVNKGIGCYLKLDIKPFAIPMLLVFFVMFVTLPSINLLGAWNAEMELPEFMSKIENWMRAKEDSAMKLTHSFLNMETTGQLLFNLFMIAMLPAIGEELVFRGIIQRLFFEGSKNMHVAIILSAFLFSAFHIQFYGFLPRFLLGVLFGYLFYWGGSIWYAILAHFINNGMAVILYYSFGIEKVEQDIEALGANMDSIGLLVFSILLTGLGLYVFKRSVIEKYEKS